MSVDFVQRMRSRRQMRDTSLRRVVDECRSRWFVRNLAARPFPHVLIETESFIEHSQCGFEAPSDVIAFVMIETFVVGAAEPENNTDISGFREKHAVCDPSDRPYDVVQRPGLPVLLRDLAQLNHWGTLRKTT